MSKALLQVIFFTTALFLVSSYVGFQVPLLTKLVAKATAAGVNATVAASTLCVASLLGIFKLTANENIGADGKVKSTAQATSLFGIRGWYSAAKNVAEDTNEYMSLHDESKGGDVNARKSSYMKMVNHYYNLATDFYEYGWGKCFHFGRRFTGEEFHASLARHEHYLALRGGFGPGMNILDLGCGVGGPMRAIARFSGCNVIGINNNAYQIERGTLQNKQAGLDKQCKFIQCDFMHLSVPDESADGAYAIEATCHAPDKVACFKQIYSKLKPGASFLGYEWCMTDKYDPNNAQHRLIKKQVEEGDALPDIVHTSEVVKALKAAGFEVNESADFAPVDEINNVSWYSTVEDKGFTNLANFRHSKLGTTITHCMVTILEFLRLAPKGTVQTHSFLLTALKGLEAGGKLGIFTPMFYFKATKPLSARRR